MRDQVAQPGGGAEPKREIPGENVVIGQSLEDLTVALRNVPSLVSEPVRREGDRLLEGQEQVQGDDLPSRAVSAEGVGGRWKHCGDAFDSVPDGRQLLGENDPIDHARPLPRHRERPAPRPA